MEKHNIGFAFGIRRSRNTHVLDVQYSDICIDSNTELLDFLTDKLSIESTGYYKISKSIIFDLLDSADQVLKSDLLKKEIEVFANYTESSTHSYSSNDLGVFVTKDLNSSVSSVEEAYFKLQALSQLKVKPHSVNLDSLFPTLNNIAWTNIGPILAQDLDEVRLNSKIAGRMLHVSHVDKFPYMVDYFVPEGVRIVSGSQVRLGAHLSPGTTVMPAGYVNFNAGTMGNAMVEGRISAGVVVGKNTDIGGGASIMGTLSGGNKTIISIGDECLLGANSGTGISLGFGCTIAAGVYVTAGAKVRLYNSQNDPIDLDNKVVSEGNNLCKGSDLSSRNKLLFLNDSSTGHLICRPNPNTIELNESLHQNI
jgi:2,3,4,5-tetrahydropyridine-2-carboxylate N-succinyltransferase